MREIKFRAWNKENKTMNQVKSLSFVAHQDGSLLFIDAGWKHNPETFELMQYTGKKDKNDTEIYEGDIVRDNGFLDDGERIGKIVWLNKYNEMGFVIESIKGKSFYDYDGKTFSVKELEVIGNIYENPELVK